MNLLIPNRLQVCALIVSLGLVIPGLALSQERAEIKNWPVRGAQLAFKPVRTVLNGLTFQWAEDALHHPALGAYFSDDGLNLNDEDHRSQDVALNVGWKPLPQSQLRAGMVSEAFLVDPQPGVYFRLQHRW